MASNSLLALLNFSNSSASSSSPAPPKQDDESRSLSIDTSSPSPTFGLAQMSSSSAAANNLLQSILSPNAKAKVNPMGMARNISGPEEERREYSSPINGAALAPSPIPLDLNATRMSQSIPLASPRNSSNDLLALLSGKAGGSKSSEADKPDAAAMDNTSFHRSDQKIRQRPIGTPPGTGSRAEQSRSPAPTVFDSPNIFDILRQPIEMDKKVTPKASKSNKPVIVDDVIVGAPSKSQLFQPPAVPSFASTLATPYVVNPQVHAIQQLSGLHASAGFEDSISSGLESNTDGDGVRHTSLDLKAPQPAGPSSLYPAKLEISPISVLTTAFTPSFYIDAQGRTPSAQWQCQRVASLQGRYAMYIMSKGRIRIINQENGNRHFAKAASVGIRSIITPLHGDTKSSRPLIAAITETDSLCIWSLEDLAPQQEARLIANVQADVGQTFSSAIWKFNKDGHQDLVVLQSNGIAATLAIKDLETVPTPQQSWTQSPKNIWATPTSEDHYPVSMTLSPDGTLAAIIEATHSDQAKLILHLVSLSQTHLKHTVVLPALNAIKASKVSFSCFASQAKDEMPRCLIIGCDLNQTVAVIDLAKGILTNIYRFVAPAPSFSLAAWHATTSTLLLCCSIRSSIFSMKMQFTPLPSLDQAPAEIAKKMGVEDGAALDNGGEVLYRIKAGLMSCDTLTSHPRLRECALPDPYSSIAIDGSSTSILLLATHIGGIHSLTLPEEALKQTFTQQQPNTHSNSGVSIDNVVKVKDTAEVAKVNADDALAASNPESSEKEVSPPRPTQSNTDTPSKSHKGEGKKKGRKTNPKSAANERAADGINGEMKERLDEGEVKSTDAQSATAAQLIADRSLPVIEEAISKSVSVHLRQAIDDAVARTLPKELRDMMMGQELSQHLIRSITTAIVHPVQQTAMDVVSRAMAPHFETVMMDMTRSIENRIEMSMTGIRKDIVTEQSKSLIEAEAKIDQLTMQLNKISQLMTRLVQQNESVEKSLEELHTQAATNAKTSTKNGSVSAPTEQVKSRNDRAFPTLSQAPDFFNGSSTSQEMSSQPVQYNATSRPLQSMERQEYTSTEQMTDQEVEDVLLAALSSANIDVNISPVQAALGKIQTSRGSPAQALTTISSGHRVCISQAVILTLFHRLVQSLNGNIAQSVIQPELAVPWLEACAANLNRNDQSIGEVFGHIRQDLIAQLINAHQRFRDRATWWTNERLAYGILQYLQ